ncbi:tRNA adenosine(34) deaminase TadA [Arsukibacterium sp.]|uniref:tRNA adenosine(34) deaminase TadA n=1 Tax=Arsukibacterium sp. TaxID=1977258 RepID=UPI002FD9A032
MTDEYWMQQAIKQAELAEQAGEVPVGAVLVKDHQLLAAGYNQMISLHDPSAHAEMQAVRQAAQQLQNYRLIDCTLYVTLEPCTMCAGMLVHSRVSRLVYGASDYKTGAAGSVLDVVRQPQFNHQLQVTAGVLAEQCGAQLSAFFQRRRQEKKQLKQLAALAPPSPPIVGIVSDNCAGDDAV